MDYIEFLEELRKLYKKYFNQSGVNSSFNEKETNWQGFIQDKLTIQMPKELTGMCRFYISSSKKDFISYGIYAPVKVEGKITIHREDKNTHFTPDEIIYENWHGIYKIDTLLKKFDKLFAQMLKLIKSTTNDKFARIAKKVFADTATPWGLSQHSEQIARGLIAYSTASHGGLCVSPTLANKLTRYTLKRAIRYANGYWFEEDAAYALPLYELWQKGYDSKIKSAYGNISLDSLEKIIKYFYKDYPFNEKEEDNGIAKLPLKVKDLKPGDRLVIYGKTYIYEGIRYGSLSIVLESNTYLDYAMKEGQYKRAVEKIIRDGKVLFER